MLSLLELIKKIPALKRKEREIEDKGRRVEWAVRKFDELDEDNKRIVRDNGFACAFAYEKEGESHATH